LNAGRDVLMLVLQNLVVRVRRVEAGLRRLDVEVERPVEAGLRVEPVEQADVVAP